MARGFQKIENPQLNSLPVAKESLKWFMSVAAHNGFELAFVDIKAAFLQSKTLDREVLVKPSEDQRKE